MSPISETNPITTIPFPGSRISSRIKSIQSETTNIGRRIAELSHDAKKIGEKIRSFFLLQLVGKSESIVGANIPNTCTMQNIIANFQYKVNYFPRKTNVPMGEIPRAFQAFSGKLEDESPSHISLASLAHLASSWAFSKRLRNHNSRSEARVQSPCWNNI